MFTCQWWQEIMELFRFKVNELKFIVLLMFIVATTAGTPALPASKKKPTKRKKDNMENLKLHSNGKDENLELLKKEFENKKDIIKNNKELNLIQKEEAIKKLEPEYKKSKRDLEFGLF